MGENRKIEEQEDIAEVIRKRLELHKKKAGANINNSARANITSFRKSDGVRSDISPLKYQPVQMPPISKKTIPIDNSGNEKKSRKRKILWIILVILIVLAFLGILIVLFFILFSNLFYKPSARFLQVNEHLDRAEVFNEEYVNALLAAGVDFDKIVNLSFVFRSFDGLEYSYSPRDIRRDYQISSDDLNLDNFKKIIAAKVILEFKLQVSPKNDTPIVFPINTTSNQTNQTLKIPSGGGSGGGGGSTSISCTDTCNTLGYNCGNFSICTVAQNCGICTIRDRCEIGKCVLAGNLVSYWNLDGNALDSIGGNHGVINGTLLALPGVNGSSYKFDGFEDNIEIANNETLDLREKITISAWVYLQPTSSNYSGIFWKDDNIVIRYSQLEGNKFIGLLRINQSTQHQVETGPYTSYYNWYHVVLTYDSHEPMDNLKIFINGEIKDQATCSGLIDNSSGNLYFGFSNNLFDESFKGRIDEVKIWDYALNQEEVLLEYESLKPRTGLVSSYRFEGNLLDDSGINNAESIGNPGFVEGINNQAIKVSSVDYLNILDSSSLDINEELTILAWVKRDAFVNHGKVIIKRTDNYNSNPWELYSLDFKGSSPGYPCFLLSNGSVGSHNSLCGENHSLSLNEWHHIAGTYNGSLMSLFIDGVFEDSQESMIKIGTNDMPVTIGAINYSDFYTNGSIDEVMIFNRALSVEEILDIYNSQNAITVPSLSIFDKFWNWVKSIIV